MNQEHKQTLLIAGALLFLIGLLSGVVVQLMENSRMGLSAHLAGVQNALFLLVIGAAWGHVRLSQLAAAVGVWFAIGSMYGFWFALQLAAIWGTSRATPIAGLGFEGSAWQEALVEVLLMVSSGVAIGAAVVVLYGYWQGRREGKPNPALEPTG